MDFKGLIDFNKYTLALAAGGFVYVLEKLVPMETLAGRVAVLVLLVLFFLSVLTGLAIFAAGTAALHADNNKKQKIEGLVPKFGTAHMVFLCLGMIMLGVMLYDRVMSPPKPQAQRICVCP